MFKLAQKLSRFGWNSIHNSVRRRFCTSDIPPMPFVLGESFFGREKELDRLAREIYKKQKSLYVLTGPPNCGKSRLMSEFLYQHMGDIFAVTLDLRGVNLTSHKDFMVALEKALRNGLKLLEEITVDISTETTLLGSTKMTPLVSKIAEKISKFYPDVQPVLHVIGVQYENATHLVQIMDKILEFEAKSKNILNSGEFSLEVLDQIIDAYWKIFSRIPQVSLPNPDLNQEKEENLGQLETHSVSESENESVALATQELPSNNIATSKPGQFLIYIDEVGRLAPLVSPDVYDGKVVEENIWNIDSLFACLIRNSKQLRKCSIVLSASDSFLPTVMERLPTIRTHVNAYKVLTVGWMDAESTRKYLLDVCKLDDDYAQKLQDVFGGDIMSLNDAIEDLGTTKPDPEVVDKYLEGKIAAARLDIEPSKFVRQFGSLVTPEVLDAINELYKELVEKGYIEKQDAEDRFGIDVISTLIKLNVFYERRPENISDDILSELASKVIFTANSPLHHKAIANYVKDLESVSKSTQQESLV